MQPITRLDKQAMPVSLQCSRQRAGITCGGRAGLTEWAAGLPFLPLGYGHACPLRTLYRVCTDLLSKRGLLSRSTTSVKGPNLACTPASKLMSNYSSGCEHMLRTPTVLH